MTLGRLLLAGAVCFATLWAHPMGNFSVSHYARIAMRSGGADLTYVLDLAEIPTFELLQQWKMDPATPRDQIKSKVDGQAREWVKHLRITANGQPVTPAVRSVQMAMQEGAGNMPVLRVTTHLAVTAEPGAVTYEDLNYPDRAGWKEVALVAGPGATVSQSSVPLGTERSQALTVYPTDPAVAPPQELKASLTWSAPGGGATPVTKQPVAPTVVSPPAATPTPQSTAPVVNAPTAPRNREPATSPTLAQQQQAPGTVVAGDYLSQLLSRKELSLGLILAGLCVAFGFGAMHALSPGHGKTLVAAYLVGSRGTAAHALFLGGMVTFTHTISVFALGLVTMFLSQYILPEKIYPILGAISGLSIVIIGAMLFYRRAQLLARHSHKSGHHHHNHDHGHAHHHQGHEHVHMHHRHDHGHVHSHSHEHEYPHEHDHHHGHVHDHGHEHHHHEGLVHTHDGHTHSHVPEGKVTMASLIALGASGGLVPCPSAMVLLLSAITLGRVGFGLLLLIAFSAGLAVVLTGIGLFVVYAKHLLPERARSAQHPAFRLVPVLSAAAITIIGLVMTGVSLGWIKPEKFLS